MVDNMSESEDEAMADRILGLDDERRGVIKLPVLKRYIAYAKTFTPTIPDDVNELLKEYYIEKRQQKKGDVGIQLSPRQLEALERLTVAKARSRLSDEATREDAMYVMKLFDVFLSETCRDPYTGEIDIDLLHNVPSSLRKQSELVPGVAEMLMEQDEEGRDFVLRKPLEKWLVQNWNVNALRAKQVVEMAIKKDLIWCPYVDRVKVN
jgi:DNA replicative helicase MCM subunit Mcm2 (Cdc46/Mcm family)